MGLNTTLFPWGPFAVSVFSLSFSAAIIAGLITVIIVGRRENIPTQLFIDFILISVVCGVVGSRLGHVLFVSRHYYFQQPERIIHLQDGGVSFWGGFLLALLAVIIWAGRRNYVVEHYLDAAAPALALSLSIGEIGYPQLGEVMSASYSWGIVKLGQVVHPEGAYTIVLLMALYFYLTYRHRQLHYKGELILTFIVGYGLINIIMDYFRTLPVLWGGVTAGQVVSIIMIILGIICIVGGSKIYPSSYYFERRIHRRPPHRLRLPARILGAIVVTAGQLYLYFIVNGSPVGFPHMIPW